MTASPCSSTVHVAAGLLGEGSLTNQYQPHWCRHPHNP